METKTCPSCGAEVPVVATRCKSCFHDFDAPPTTSGSPMALLIALAASIVVAGVAFWYLSQRPTDQKILVDQETRTVQWLTQYQGERLDVDRVTFDEIDRLEYVVTYGGDYEIAAFTRDGERKIIEAHPDRPLELQAERYARIMDKPLDKRDETTGFMKAR